MRNRNPLLKKKFAEGYERGVEQGVKESVKFVSDRFSTLHEVEGIGIKTIDRIKEHFGREFFKEE